MEFSRTKIIYWTKRLGPIALGAFGGFLYYTYIGCNSNSCAITSDPYISTVYGAVMGSVFTQWGNKKNKKSEENEEGKIEG
jgi:hypothetical protein